MFWPYPQRVLRVPVAWFGLLAAGLEGTRNVLKGVRCLFLEVPAACVLSMFPGVATACLGISATCFLDSLRVLRLNATKFRAGI